ncbi:unnamed protein product [Ascophyllum nodosum]
MSTMDLEIAAGYGECSVCFEPLCTKGSSIMTDGTGQAASYFPTRCEILPRRICRHFLCQECAPTIVNHKCPVCRRDFIDTFDVPDPLEDPVRWFHVVDVDQSGTIEKSELVDALKGMFPIDPDALERAINENWNTWDADGNGTLDASEFRNLLAPFLEETMGNLRKRINKDLPDLAREPMEWFDYWDEDESGTLERPEVVRALIKTIPRLNGRDEAWLTGMFATIWSLFDPNGDGQIDYSEFRMTDGLHETLVANFL